MAQTTFDNSHPRSPSLHATPGGLLDHTLDLARVRWETIAWLIVLPLALLLRVLWLHAWPLSPAEGAVASSLWSLLTTGQVTAAPPVEVGPVVALFSVLWLFLFGAFDDSLRVGTALVGFATVAACWWLRPYLGRVGALVGAALLTWSPLAVYEARQLAPEPYAVLFLLVLAIALLRLYSGGGRSALVVAALAFTLAVFSHFLALPMALLLIAFAPLAFRLSLRPASGETTPAAASPPDAPRLDGQSTALTRPSLTSRDWALAVVAVVASIMVLGLLTSAGGLALFGTLLSPLTAWAAMVPPPDRSTIFVPLLLLIYEPLILVGGIASAWVVGSARDDARRRLATILLVAWAVVGLLVGALLGDRSPGQALYTLLPLALLSGYLIAAILAAIPWDQYRRVRGPVLSAVSVLALIALVLLVNALTAPAVVAGPARVVKLALDTLLALGLVGAALYLARPFGARTASLIISLTVFAVLALYGVRSTTQLAFVQPASATELAVQQQTTPGLTSVVERIDRLSRDATGMRRTYTDVTGGHGLTLAIDESLAQPLDWYFREYPNRTYFAPTTSPPGTPEVIIISAQAEESVQAILDQAYVGQSYPFAWSFPAEGISGGLSELTRYLLYREPRVAPTASEFSVYLRRDLADRVLFKGTADTASAPASPTGLAFNVFDRNGRGRAAGQLDSPRGIAVDSSGGIYVVDTANTRLQKFDNDGIFQWSVGNPGSGPGQFARIQNGPGPTGIAVDDQGNIYVADTWNHRIAKFDPQGRFLTSWGGFVNTQGNQEVGRQHPREFYGPRSIAIGPDNNLYVTDTGNKRVLVFDPEGKPIRQWGSVGAGPDNLNEPVGIAIDRTGTVYVADVNNGRIAVFDLEGKPQAQWPVTGWGAGIYQEPYIAVTDDGIYVTSGATRSVLHFDKQGKLLGEEQQIDGVDLVNPTGITVAPDGSLLVVDAGSHAVLRAGQP